MTWNNYDPAKPPGDDDWPIVTYDSNDGEYEQYHGRNIVWKDMKWMTAWMPIPTYTPPEPDLPKLWFGGEEIQFEEQINGWRISSEGNVYVDNLDNYPTRAEAHAAVVEMLGSFRVGDHEVVLIDRELPLWESRYQEAERCVKEIREQWAAETERRKSAERVMDVTIRYHGGHTITGSKARKHRANYPKEGE